MQHQETPAKRSPSGSRGSHDGQKRWLELFRFLAVLVSVMQLVGCAATGISTAKERIAISQGEKTIVLFRVECTMVEDQRSYEPFPGSVLDDNVSFGLGDFRSGGEPKRLPTLSFLSSESRRDGWTYIVRPPGIYYLAAYPPRRTGAFTYDRSLKYATRWRLDVPEKAKLVYAGTLHLTGASDWLLLGGRAMRSIQSIRVDGVSDQERARKLFAEHFPDMGEMQVVLIQRQDGEPTILRSPLPTSTK
jgi:hypothetical protein